MRVVIVSDEMGVFLGSCMGLGLFTLLDPAGQPEAVTFKDAEEAAAYIRAWDSHNDPDKYRFVPVGTGKYATIAELKDAGLADLLGEMEADALRYAAPAGQA